MTLSLLLFFFAFSFANKLESDDSVRFLFDGSVGSDSTQNKTCYFLSGQYQTIPSGAVGDIFGAIMGYNLGGGVLTDYPFTALAYVRGTGVDLNSYQDKSYTSVEASGAVVAWAFGGIGEFCDRDGVQGYQGNIAHTCLTESNSNLDCIINSFTGPEGAPYNQTCGINDTTICKDNFPCYYGVTHSVENAFVHTCRIWSQSITVNGRTFTPNEFKCDLLINYTNLWATVTTCPANQRKIGVLVNFAAAVFDDDVTVTSNINRGNGNNAGYISLGSGHFKAIWDGWYFNSASSTTTGSVTGFYTQTLSASYSYLSASVVKQIIFAFDKTYAQATATGGDSIFLWDPTTEVFSAGMPLRSVFAFLFAAVASMFLF